MKRAAPLWFGVVAAFLSLLSLPASLWAIDAGWLQKGVRVWYLGAVDGGGGTSSNAEEAHRIDLIAGDQVQLTRHSALDHWNSPRPEETATYPLSSGACWIHPLALQNLKMGDYWLGQEITLVIRSAYTYDTFPYRLLPVKALFDLKPQREIVKISYMIAGFSVGNAYFDADTGLLLYYHTLWGAYKMFFILSEINYDFARQAAFSEDDGPHTGFKSLVSEQSMKQFGVPGGGSVIIQSLVETRYGGMIEMRVLSSISGPSGGLKQADENYCFFGSVPVVRYMDASTAPNFPPDQWTPRGTHLWWWVPIEALHQDSINVLDVPMARNASTPFLFTTAESTNRFYFSSLWFDADGYMTRFSAKDPLSGLDVDPGDFIFQNLTTVYGRDYYQNVMKRAIPDITPPAGLPGMVPLLLN